jgi:hypothetical protein
MAIDLIKRKDWQARAPHGDYTQLDSTKGVKVHYTGGRVNPNIVDDHEGCVSLVQSIQKSHMDGNGWIDIGYCVDEETEILTRQGWRSYRDLREGDVVLTLDHRLGVSEWQPVLEVCVFPARAREMVRMRGGGHSSLTTPDHRWPVERYRGRTGAVRRLGADGRWTATGRAAREVTGYERLWVTTETIGDWDHIPVAAPCADLPVEPKWSDAFVELVAWFSAGGTTVPRASGAVMHRSHANSAHVARVRAALTEVFGPPAADLPHAEAMPRWQEATDTRRAAFHLSAEAARRLLDAAPGGVPSLGFLLTLTRAQLSLFIETCLVAGDAGKDGLAHRSRAAAEAYMYAVLLSGGSATLRAEPPARSRRSGRWTVDAGRRQHVAPRPGAPGGTGLTVSRETYHGEIWCPRTENQSWLARRDGTVYFTGNTYVACPHRKVFEGRGLHHLPAANGAGLNSGHYAVLGLVGNSGLVTPTDEILDAILDAIDYLRDKGRAGKEIKGHRDGYSTDCPGDALYAWVKKGAPRPGSETRPPETTPSPPATSPEYPGRPLRYPPVMSGDDVRVWQTQMAARGWDIMVDGSYGPESRDICRRFQRSQHIEDDGIVGPTTWKLTWSAPLA